MLCAATLCIVQGRRSLSPSIACCVTPLVFCLFHLAISSTTANPGTVCTTFPEACALPAAAPSTEGDVVAPPGKADAAALSYQDQGVICLLQAERILIEAGAATRKGSIASAVHRLNATATARPPYLPMSALARKKMDDAVEGDGNRSSDEAQPLEAAGGGLLQPMAFTDATYPHDIDLRQSLSDRGQKTAVIGIIVLLVFSGSVVAVVVWRSLARTVGRFIQGGIEMGAPLVIGVGVSLDSLAVDLFHGKVTISNMTVHNPKVDEPYKSPYLFHADTVVANIDMLRLLFSNFQTIEVEEVVFYDVTAMYDQPALLSQKSNVHDVMDYLDQPTLLSNVSDVTGNSVSSGNKEELAAKGHENEAKEQNHEDGGNLILHRLKIEEVVAEAFIDERHVSFKLPPTASDDFQKECSCTKTAEVVKALVHKVLRRMMDDVPPHFPSEGSTPPHFDSEGSALCAAS